MGETSFVEEPFSVDQGRRLKFCNNLYCGDLTLR